MSRMLPSLPLNFLDFFTMKILENFVLFQANLPLKLRTLIPESNIMPLIFKQNSPLEISEKFFLKMDQNNSEIIQLWLSPYIKQKDD